MTLSKKITKSTQLMTASPTLKGAPLKPAHLTSVLEHAQRVVIKVGSSLVTNQGQGLDQAAINMWVKQIAYLRRQGKQVVLVSSGAIAEGIKRLGWLQRPSEIHELQAAAAVGQMGLVQMYETCFRQHAIQTAQILLTNSDLADRTRYLNARSTLLTLLNLGVIPIINENDTVVTDEIRVGDNDTLSSLIANLIEADVLVILTDQQGVFTADPRVDATATLITQAVAGDPHLETIAGGAGSSVGTGGMLTKILAAKRAARSGASTVIAYGREVDVLVKLAQGQCVGTQLLAQCSRLSARQQWLASHLQVTGKVLLDAGAIHALQHEGKSLLPIGVVGIEGDFLRGDLVLCCTIRGKEIGRGLINYASTDARRIIKQPSSVIEKILGYKNEPEMIHRDNLLLI
jgi:glutamate 5-kinase